MPRALYLLSSLLSVMTWLTNASLADDATSIALKRHERAQAQQEILRMSDKELKSLEELARRNRLSVVDQHLKSKEPTEPVGRVNGNSDTPNVPEEGRR